MQYEVLFHILEDLCLNRIRYELKKILQKTTQYLKIFEEYNISQNYCCWTVHLLGILCMKSCFGKRMIFLTLKSKNKKNVY